MPNSSPLGKNFIKEWFDNQKNITHILDIGPGEGTYYNLLGPGYHWTGVEVWEDNVKRFDLKSRYDKIVISSIDGYHPDPPFQCVIFGDVLEHLPKDIATRIIQDYVDFFDHVIISIPLGEYPQGAIDGNPYEEHKSTWSYDEIKSMTAWERTCTLAINPQMPEVMQIGIFIK